MEARDRPGRRSGQSLYPADEIQIGSLYTALPQGESWESFGAGLLVVRPEAQMIRLPVERRTWAPDGIMAYSKICPHAGCAISLYRYPTYAPTGAPPAFTCPCHDSTFTPGDGGQVIFGPAGRALPIPFVGGQLASLVWGGQFPGPTSFLARLEIIHVLLIPAALATLIAIHLGMIMRQHHSQFPGPGRKERNVVGTPLWPAYALRSIGLLLAVAAVLVLMGGLIQINPVWQWGPFHSYLSENGPSRTASIASEPPVETADDR